MPLTGQLGRTLAALNVNGSATGTAAELELPPQGSIQLYEEALQASKETLGGRHVDTLTAITKLGTRLVAMGQLEQARPLFEEELQASREKLGNFHLETLISISNVGQLLQAMGQLEQARPLFEEALQASRETLGERHSNTLASISNMSMLLEDIGKLEEASGVHAIASGGACLSFEGLWIP